MPEIEVGSIKRCRILVLSAVLCAPSHVQAATAEPWNDIALLRGSAVQRSIAISRAAPSVVPSWLARGIDAIDAQLGLMRSDPPGGTGDGAEASPTPSADAPAAPTETDPGNGGGNGNGGNINGGAGGNGGFTLN